MLICPYCSHANPLTSTHCVSCGADLNESPLSQDNLPAAPSTPTSTEARNKPSSGSFRVLRHDGKTGTYTPLNEDGPSGSFRILQQKPISPPTPIPPKPAPEAVHAPDPTAVAPLDRDTWKKAVEQALAQRIEQRSREQGTAPAPPPPKPTPSNTQAVPPEKRTYSNLRLPSPANPNRSGQTDEFKPNPSRIQPNPSSFQSQTLPPPPMRSTPTPVPKEAPKSSRANEKPHTPEATEQINIAKLREELLSGEAFHSPAAGELEEVFEEEIPAPPTTEVSQPLLQAVEPLPPPPMVGTPQKAPPKVEQDTHQPEESTDPSIQVNLPWEEIEAQALAEEAPAPTFLPEDLDEEPMREESNQRAITEKSGIHEANDAYIQLLEEAQLIDEYDNPTQVQRHNIPVQTDGPRPIAINEQEQVTQSFDDDLDQPTHLHEDDDFVPHGLAPYEDDDYEQYMDPHEGDDLLSLHRMDTEAPLPDTKAGGLDLHTLHSLLIDPHRDPSQALWAFFEGEGELEELGAIPEETPKRKKPVSGYANPTRENTNEEFIPASLQEIPLVPSDPELSGPATHDSLEDVANYSALQVWIQLDVELQRRGTTLPLSQQWMLLSDLSEQLVEKLRKHGLSIDEQRPDRLQAHTKKGLQALLLGLQVTRTLQEFVTAYPPLPNDGRARARCVVTLLTDDISDQEAREQAQRLFQHMPMGRIWLDWSAQMLLKEHEDLREIALPDMEEPAYEIDWQPALAPAVTEDLGENLLPFFGREDVLQQLSQAWQRSHAGSPQILSLIGQPGSGRSRILQQWSHLQPPPVLFWGNAEDCPQERSPSPYLASLLQSHMRHLHLDGPQALYQHIATHAQEDPHWQAWTSLLFELWNAETSRDRPIEDAMRWYIHHYAQRAPVALLLDDLFLLDLRCQRFLEALLREPPPHLFVLIAASPGDADTLLLSSRVQVQVIEIDPLSRDESIALLQSASAENPLSPKQQEQLLQESEGNPRILLSLLQSVQRQLEQRETLSDNLHLPQTVEGLLLKHLQGLSSLAQDTLRKAAMIGDTFWQGAIESLERMNLAEGAWGFQEGIAIANLDNRNPILQELVEKKLIQKQDRSSLPGEIEYRFHQKLLRQMMLQQIPLSIRQQMHRRVAEWMQLQDQEGRLIEEIVAHLKQADARNEAARTLFDAAKRRRQLGQKQDALRLMGEALEELSTPQRATRLLWLDTMLRTSLQLGDIHATSHLSHLALQLSWRFNNIRWASQFYLHLGICARLQFQVNAARDHLLNAHALAERHQDDVLRIEIWLQLALLALTEGQIDEAKRCLQAVEAILETPQAYPPPTSPHSVRCLIARLEGRWADADRHSQAARADARREKTGHIYARTLIQEAELYLLAGDDEGALRMLGEPTETLRRQECLFDLTNALLIAAQALLNQRKTQQAHERLLEAWQATQITGYDIHIGQVAAALAASHVLQNQYDAAVHFSRITEQKLRTGSPTERALMYFFLGETCAGLPKHKRQDLLHKLPQRLPEGGLSTFLFLKSVELFQKAKDTARHCNSLLSLGRALLNDGHRDVAYNVLERGSREAQEAGIEMLCRRFENQKRLLTDEPPPPIDVHRPSSATLVVRADRLKRSPEAVPPVPDLPKHLRKKKN
ncbi:MAG: AAA family ATPase [Myxococcales bacterium]|nr:AAA family ATPase [Myxococcales bacterium]